MTINYVHKVRPDDPNKLDYFHTEIEKKSELLGIVEDCYRPDILESISKKLDTLYFS